jgi:O-antigen/teichoic acid export membrane protein
VLLQRFSEKRNLGQSLKKEAGGTFLMLLGASVVFITIIKAWAEPLFQFVFGDEWLLSGSYATILVFAFAIKFMVSPFNMVFTAFKKIGILSIWQTIYLLLILLLVFIPFNNIETFLKTYVWIEVISYSIIGILDAAILLKYERKLIRRNS